MLSGRYAWFQEDVLDPAGDGPLMPTHAPAAAEQFGAVSDSGRGHGHPVSPCRRRQRPENCAGVTAFHRSPRYRNDPYLLSSPGALTAFTIHLTSRPAVAAATAAMAEESRRCLWLMAVSRAAA
jgi:hypothetical protein